MLKITSAKWMDNNRKSVIVNLTSIVPDDPDNLDYVSLVEWVSAGNIIQEPDIVQPRTNKELIDLAGPVMVAFLRAYAIREGLTMTQIKNAIVAEM